MLGRPDVVGFVTDPRCLSAFKRGCVKDIQAVTEILKWLIPTERNAGVYRDVHLYNVVACGVCLFVCSGSGQPGLVVGDPAHSRGGGLKRGDRGGPFQPGPFRDSMIQ